MKNTNYANAITECSRARFDLEVDFAEVMDWLEKQSDHTLHHLDIELITDKFMADCMPKAREDVLGKRFYEIVSKANEIDGYRLAQVYYEKYGLHIDWHVASRWLDNATRCGMNLVKVGFGREGQEIYSMYVSSIG